MLEVAQKVCRDDVGKEQSKTSVRQVKRCLVEEWLCFIVDLLADQKNRRAFLSNDRWIGIPVEGTLQVEVLLEVLSDGSKVERESIDDHADFKGKLKESERLLFLSIEEATTHPVATLLERHDVLSKKLTLAQGEALRRGFGDSLQMGLKISRPRTMVWR